VTSGHAHSAGNGDYFLEYTEAFGGILNFNNVPEAQQKMFEYRVNAFTGL
jgi:hypothetical protein